jgi:hypothetical protein
MYELGGVLGVMGKRILFIVAMQGSLLSLSHLRTLLFTHSLLIKLVEYHGFELIIV